MAGKTILIITVGGSPDPIVKSISHHKPDFVFFICSASDAGSEQEVDGETQRTTGKPTIVDRAGLRPDQYEKVTIPLPDIDHVHAIYNAVVETFDRAVQEEGVSVIVDYTGGTKSMTGAILRAATGRYATECVLSVVGGTRSGKGVVISGTEKVEVYAPTPITQEDTWDEALRMFNLGQYSSAEATLDRLLQQIFSPRLQRKARTLKGLCHVFDQWDRFLYRGANNDLITWSSRPESGAIAVALAPFTAEIAVLAQGPTTLWTARSLLPVLDMWRNARRRAALGRYDDALIRLYRAVEMVGQVRLFAAYGIDANNLSLRSPRPRGPLVETALRQWRVRHGRADYIGGLTEDYRLLKALREPSGAPDHVSVAYEDHRATLHRCIVAHRNKSILVHGFGSSTREEFSEADEAFDGFLTQVQQDSRFPVVAPRPFPELTQQRFP